MEKTDRKIENLVKNLYASLVNLLASSLCISWLLRLREDAKRKYNLRPNGSSRIFSKGVNKKINFRLKKKNESCGLRCFLITNLSIVLARK